MDERRKRPINWGSLIGWLIFALVIAGGPILRLVSQLFGGGVTLPANILPILVGVLVLLSILIPAIRAAGNAARSRGTTRLPTSQQPPVWPSNAPMPPFGNQPYAGRLSPPPRSITPPAERDASLPAPPRFEPVINPTILALGVIGMLVLIGIGLFVVAQSAP